MVNATKRFSIFVAKKAGLLLDIMYYLSLICPSDMK